MDILKNQALIMHPVFFDQLNKKVFMKENGNIDSMQYIEDPGAIDVLENKNVCFRFYAPEAKTVEVAGLGGDDGERTYHTCLGWKWIFFNNSKGNKAWIPLSQLVCGWSRSAKSPWCVWIWLL